MSEGPSTLCSAFEILPCLNPPDSQRHSRDKLASGSQWEGIGSPWIQPQYVTRDSMGWHESGLIALQRVSRSAFASCPLLDFGFCGVSNSTPNISGIYRIFLSRTVAL